MVSGTGGLYASELCSRMLRMDSVLAAVPAVGRPSLPQAAFNCLCRSSAATVNCSADRCTFSSPLPAMLDEIVGPDKVGPTGPETNTESASAL